MNLRMAGEDVIKPALFSANLVLVGTVGVLQLIEQIDQLISLLEHLLLELVQLWRHRRVHASAHWLPVHRFLHGWRVLLPHGLIGAWRIARRRALGRIHSGRRIVVRRVGALGRIVVHRCRRIVTTHANHTTHRRVLLSAAPTIIASCMAVITWVASLTT